MTTLSLIQSEALRRFARDAELAETSRKAEKRLDARQSLARAKAALPARDGAIVDLVMIRGRSLTALAIQAGTTVEALDALLRQAANTLADHYQADEAA